MQTRQYVFLVLFVFLLARSSAVAGLMMDDMVFKTDDESLWSLALSGGHRYAGGAISLERAERVSPANAGLGPLRLGPADLGALVLVPKMWQSVPGTLLPGLNRLLLMWSIRVLPAQPVQPRALLSENLLLLPEQVRITVGAGTIVAE